MTTKANICILLLFWIYSNAYGQMDKYKYSRQLEGVSEQWHRITLPHEVFGKVQGNLSDVRLFGILANKDTIEVPYLLRIKSDKISEIELQSKTINSVNNENGYYYTLEVGADKAINLIKLYFGENNFDWKIQLEGSQNQQEWFTILEDYRILSINNGLTDFQFAKLAFPTVRFKYYRLLIPSEKDPKFLSATILDHKSTNGELDQFPIVKKEHIKTSTKKLTEIDLTLLTPVPLSSIKINVLDKIDYYRSISISYLADSFETQQGWRYNYRTLTSGTLNSLEENEFRFQRTILKKLKVEIQNQDNQPLSLGDFEARGFVHELIGRFDQPGSYFLVYGNDTADMPNYDLQQFSDKIPEQPSSVSVSDETLLLTKPNNITAPLFENNLWLWSIMALAIVLMGWFTVNMMRKKSM